MKFIETLRKMTKLSQTDILKSEINSIKDELMKYANKGDNIGYISTKNFKTSVSELCDELRREGLNVKGTFPDKGDVIIRIEW